MQAVFFGEDHPPSVVPSGDGLGGFKGYLTTRGTGPVLVIKSLPTPPNAGGKASTQGHRSTISPKSLTDSHPTVETRANQKF